MSANGDYISRSDAIEALYKDAEAHPDHTFWTTQHEALRSIPAADVREVKMGEWIPKNADGSWRVDTCSACRKDTHYVRYAPAYNFCPNCGADMMEEN